MLELAATLTDGALPAGLPPTDTADTRDRLGPDKLLVIYLDASHGDIGHVTATVQAHLAAGADHVIAGAPLGADFRTSITRLEQLAPALIPLT